LPALVGVIINSFAGFALLAALFIVLHRWRTSIRKRLTFHRDMVGQLGLSRAPTRTTAHSHPSRTTGRGREHENGRWATAAAEHGGNRAVAEGTPPRGEATRDDHGAPQHPLAAPRPGAPGATPAPARTRRQQDLADRAAMLWLQMAELQLELDRAEPAQRGDNDGVVDAWQCRWREWDERAERARGGDYGGVEGPATPDGVVNGAGEFPVGYAFDGRRAARV
jgi:hypothetical protein